MRLPALRDFALERYFARWEFRTPYLLGSSEVEGMRMAELLALADDEMRARWEALTLGYPESAGLPLLRQEVAALYERVAPDDVLVCSGAQEAILLVLSTLLGPGDHAIVVTPCYQSLADVALGAGAEVSALPLDPAARWALDVEQARRLVRRRTRAIVVNFPHSPTGALPDHDQWRALAALANECGAYLVSDEVYRFLEPDAAMRLAPAADLTPRGISIGVMSKAFALAGLRIGWVATRDAAVRERVAAAKDWTTIASSAPSELLAVMALRARDVVLARSLAIVREHRPLLDGFFARWEALFDYVPPRAGCVAFPALRARESVEAFADALRAEEGVMVLPGTLFDDAGNRFRVGIGRRGVEEALARVDRYMARHYGMRGPAR